MRVRRDDKEKRKGYCYLHKLRNPSWQACKKGKRGEMLRKKGRVNNVTK